MQTLQLPSHLQAETNVLGAAILDAPALADSMAALVADDFSLDSNQRIFRQMRKMYVDERHIDLLTLSEALRVSGELDGVGGNAYLCDLTLGIPQNADVSAYIRLLKDRSLARKGVIALQAAMQELLEMRSDASQTIDSLVGRLTDERPSSSRSIREFVPEALAELEPENYVCLRTGIPELDLMTYGGGRLGELWILGGDPSSGKSALARQLERSAISKNFPVHAFSVEVSGREWTKLHCASLARVPQWKTRQPGLLSPVDKLRMHEAGAEVCQWPHMLDDVSGLHIDELIGKARLSVMRQGTKMVTIDYLQLLHSDRRETREQLGEIVRKLKQFARTYNCLVVALSQLSRADVNEEPTMRRLKDSSWLEQAADAIVLTFRPVDENGQPTELDRLIIGKQRNGARGGLNMRLNTDSFDWESRNDVAPAMAAEVGRTSILSKPSFKSIEGGKAGSGRR